MQGNVAFGANQSVSFDGNFCFGTFGSLGNALKMRDKILQPMIRHSLIH